MKKGWKKIKAREIPGEKRVKKEKDMKAKVVAMKTEPLWTLN